MALPEGGRCDSYAFLRRTHSLHKGVSFFKRGGSTLAVAWHYPVVSGATRSGGGFVAAVTVAGW